MEEQIIKNIYRDEFKDSIEIGTPAKGGSMKLYFDANNPDIRYEGGGRIPTFGGKLVRNDGDTYINCYISTPEHAKEYAIEAKKPLFIQNLQNNSIKNVGIGSNLLKEVEEYAEQTAGMVESPSEF